ncbi:MAG: ABC transporter permease [Acidimicrobiales bacterium]
MTASVRRGRSAPTDEAPARVVTAKVSLARRLREILGARQLLVALVRKELKVKYKGSAVGFLWSMLNPAMYLVIFYVVFATILDNGIPLFPIWLLCGLLVWNFFSAVLPSATVAIVGNGALIKKVAFPREVLPLASVGAGLVHFALQGLVLLAGLIVFRHGVDPGFMLLVPYAVVTLVVLTSALAIFLSAVNVYVRDAQHLLDLALLGWFWMTPIIYPFRLASDKLVEQGLPQWIFMLNPLTPIVTTFQRAIYNRTTVGEVKLLPEVGVGYHLVLLTALLAVSLVLLVAAMAVFRRVEGNFAEEL